MSERVTAIDYVRVGPDSQFSDRVRYSTALEHQKRYMFAGMVIRDASPAVVIDAACGSGWGTAHLAEVTGAVQVVGLDIDEEALAEAQVNFSAPNLSFGQLDLSARDGTIGVPPADWIVSFETIEHIQPDKIPDFLYNLRQMARTGGKLILSTPNRELFSPYHGIEGKPWNEYHTREFVPEELMDTLHDNGWHVANLFGQRFVNREAYLGLAALWYPIRYVGQKRGLPPSHRMPLIPINGLNIISAAATSGEVRETDLGRARNAIYLTAICEQAKR